MRSMSSTFAMPKLGRCAGRYDAAKHDPEILTRPDLRPSERPFAVNREPRHHGKPRRGTSLPSSGCYLSSYQDHHDDWWYWSLCLRGPEHLDQTEHWPAGYLYAQRRHHHGPWYDIVMLRLSLEKSNLTCSPGSCNGWYLRIRQDRIGQPA